MCVLVVFVSVFTENTDQTFRRYQFEQQQHTKDHTQNIYLYIYENITVILLSIRYIIFFCYISFVLSLSLALYHPLLPSSYASLSKFACFSYLYNCFLSFNFLSLYIQHVHNNIIGKIESYFPSTQIFFG